MLASDACIGYFEAMNKMTPMPRHRQAAITIRSNEAVRLLARLTRDGRSQAQVIEDALKREAEAAPKLTPEELIAEIDAIVRPLHGLSKKTFKEIDDEMWDEYGLPI
jgi:hypothetical protein